MEEKYQKYLTKSKFVFFANDGEHGLTSTSANQVADKAKEYIKVLKKNVDSVTLYDTYISLLSNQESERQISMGWTYDRLMGAYPMLKQIADANALIAWLREGVKAKEYLTNEASNIDIYKWTKGEGLNYTDNVDPPKKYSDEDYMETLSREERNKMLRLDTFCSTLGKWLHPGGPYHEAREKMIDIITNPTITEGEGDQTVIKSRIASVSTTEADGLHFTIAKVLREKQAEYNKMMADKDDWVDKHNLEAHQEFRNKMVQHNNEQNEVAIKYNLFMKEMLLNVKKLKIAIPDSLQEIYKKMNEL